jgi:hypothetical protein
LQEIDLSSAATGNLAGALLCARFLIQKGKQYVRSKRNFSLG